jgi:methyltransferase-like protein 6
VAPAERLEADAAKQWDLFYQRNADRFFKDRHYFDREFPQLLQPGTTVLEVRRGPGCGGPAW